MRGKKRDAIGEKLAEVDAEVAALRFVVTLLVMDTALRQPDPLKELTDMSTRLTVMQNAIDEDGRGLRRSEAVRAKLDELLGVVRTSLARGGSPGA